MNLRNGQSQVMNGGKDLFPKSERRVPPLFAWHPDQKLPGVEPQIAQWNKPIERVRVNDLPERTLDLNPEIVGWSRLEFFMDRCSGRLLIKLHGGCTLLHL